MLGRLAQGCSIGQESGHRESNPVPFFSGPGVEQPSSPSTMDVDGRWAGVLLEAEPSCVSSKHFARQQDGDQTAVVKPQRGET